MSYSNANACINASPLDGCSVLNEKDEIALSPIANPGGRGTAPLRHRAIALPRVGAPNLGSLDTSARVIPSGRGCAGAA